MLGRIIAGVVAISLPLLVACGSESADAVEESSLASSPMVGAHCGRHREGSLDIFVHCGAGSRCETSSGKWILELPAEGTCVALPPAAEGELCGGTDGKLCDDGLLCEYPLHGGLNPRGHCVPKPAPGTEGGCCQLAMGYVTHRCARAGFECRPRDHVGGFCNGICIAP